MPWHLIAKAFGWRAATDEDDIPPLLVVWHPRLKRHFRDDAWKRAVRLSVHSWESSAVFAPGKAKEDDSMIEPMQQRILQAGMETAEGDTRRRLRIIERQIVSRAERMTVTECVKRRQPRRGASTWTRADERLFQQLVAELTLARRGEIDALTRKLER
jgi:hypothetical protein